MNTNAQARAIPAEGSGGTFRQSWYAVCRSADLQAGQVVGSSFLDGRVVACRDKDGVARVFSAYCPHLGADLAIGTMTDEGLRCAFHHWHFGPNGRCRRTGLGEPAPTSVGLFAFPTTEALGVVWAFNGETPLFTLPAPSRPFEGLLCHVSPAAQLDADPWVVCCNTPDWSHFATVHRFAFSPADQNATLQFEPFGVRRKFSATLEHGAGPTIDFDVIVRGTTLVLIEGVIEGAWFGVAACMGIPQPGKTSFFLVTMIDPAQSPSREVADETLRSYVAIGNRMFAEDAPIWNTIRFRQGALTRSDRALAHYLDQLRAFPRAHPSAEFIR